MQQLIQFYETDRKRLVNTMSRILRGDYAAGEDVVQEAFYRAIKFFPAYDEEKGKLSSWFNTILFNSLRDYQRASSGLADVEVDKLSVYDVFSQDTLSNNPELRTLISDNIDRVSKEKHRQILHLFFTLGYTSMEISQIEEKVSQTNVTTVVNRFRRQLKEKLK